MGRRKYCFLRSNSSCSWVEERRWEIGGSVRNNFPTQNNLDGRESTEALNSVNCKY